MSYGLTRLPAEPYESYESMGRPLNQSDALFIKKELISWKKVFFQSLFTGTIHFSTTMIKAFILVNQVYNEWLKVKQCFISKIFVF